MIVLVFLLTAHFQLNGAQANNTTTAAGSSANMTSIPSPSSSPSLTSLSVSSVTSSSPSLTSLSVSSVTSSSPSFTSLSVSSVTSSSPSLTSLSTSRSASPLQSSSASQSSTTSSSTSSSSLSTSLSKASSESQSLSSSLTPFTTNSITTMTSQITESTPTTSASWRAPISSIHDTVTMTMGTKSVNATQNVTSYYGNISTMVTKSTSRAASGSVISTQKIRPSSTMYTMATTTPSVAPSWKNFSTSEKNCRQNCCGVGGTITLSRACVRGQYTLSSAHSACKGSSSTVVRCEVGCPQCSSGSLAYLGSVIAVVCFLIPSIVDGMFY